MELDIPLEGVVPGSGLSPTRLITSYTSSNISVEDEDTSEENFAELLHNLLA